MYARLATEDYTPIEVTTHNLYFHEESPILSADGTGDIIATSGYDNVVRIWSVTVKPKAYSESTYRVAQNSSVSLEFMHEHAGFARPINCVKFRAAPRACGGGGCINENNENSGNAPAGAGPAADGPADYLLAACADGGRIMAFTRGQAYTVREADGDDAYDMAWAGDQLYAGLASGKIVGYRMERAADDSACGALRFSKTVEQKIHDRHIQGVTFNAKHGLLATHSLDGSVKVHRIVGDSLELLDVFREKIDASRGLFKRLLFTEDCLFVFTKPNTLSVYSYPFSSAHLQRKIGPLNSSLVKVVGDDAGLLFACTKKSVYIFSGGDFVVCIDNLTFMAVTDAFVLNGIL